ncbi:unnamed protein product [Clonostachys rhizophaga]|uniref:Uncharacterized protein n=1 Tax=Clonostachys rhizophaga TaxID=160324 RepID=A0A9N9VAK7_9HYPO|nr:unnamed protein product [Clonostachys rhizophaga]
MLRDQLINCRRDVPECTWQTTTISRKKYTSKEMDDGDKMDNDGYITDRMYRGNGRNNRYRRQDSRQRGRSSNGRQFGQKQHPHQRVKKCYVCGKTGSWPIKHSYGEQKAAYRRYKASSYFPDHSPDEYRQFLVWHEGDPYEDEEEVDAFLQYQQSFDKPKADNSTVNAENSATNTKLGSTNARIGITGIFLMDHGPNIASVLAERSVRHGLTREDPYNPYNQPKSDVIDESFSMNRYNEVSFQGTLPDTGAANSSTGGHKQSKALQRLQPSVCMTSPSDSIVRFGSSEAVKALGSTKIKTPLGDMTIHVVPTDAPFLLCL